MSTHVLTYRQRTLFGNHCAWFDCISRPLWLVGILALAIGGTCLPRLLAEDHASKDPARPIIQHIDLIHFSHTDCGYSDDPEVCREMQRRYVDVAIDAALATKNKPASEKFCWTAETAGAVTDWWQTATPERRQQLLQTVQSGQLEITAWRGIRRPR